MTPVRDLWRGVGAAFRTPTVLRLLGLAFTLVAGATVFYRFVEGWRWIDAVYFSVMTIATVGYGDLVPQTDLGKIFTMGFVLVGLGLFVAAASAVAQAVISGSTDSRQS